jgi:hypothetical protein
LKIKKRKMKRVYYILGTAVLISMVFFGCQKNQEQFEDVNMELKKGNNNCETIQGGNILYDVNHYYQGAPLETGFDGFGYNYQALKFLGSYFNAYAGRDGYPPYEGDDEAYLDENPGAENHWAWPHRNVNLMMKWNTEWLSKTDCDFDTKLDRHWDYETYIGSGAWLTNHQSGTYIDEEGNTCHWTYFVKIIAAPEDAYVEDGYWYSADGTEIGPQIWGSFAVIQEVSNDPCGGENGVQYLSFDHAGFGGW